MVRKTSPSEPLRSHHRSPTNTLLASRVKRLRDCARSQDISPGGMALLVPRNVQVGDQLHFELELSDRRSCALHGEICRVEDVGDWEFHKVGLRWVNLNATQVEALNSYCRSLGARIDAATLRALAV